MGKNTISTLIVMILSAFGLYCCYDGYQLYQPLEETGTIKQTGINVALKTKYDGENMYVTVRVENGWFNPSMANYAMMTDFYGKDFFVVLFENNDDDVVQKVEFSLKDFIAMSDNSAYIAKKTVEMSTKKRRKIKKLGCSYKGLYIKELVR